MDNDNRPVNPSQPFPIGSKVRFKDHINQPGQFIVKGHYGPLLKLNAAGLVNVKAKGTNRIISSAHYKSMELV